MGLRSAFAAFKDGARIFSRNNSLTNAAAISFYAFFSLLPLMVVLTATLGFILGTRSGLLDKVIAIVRDSLPYMSDRIVGDLKGLARTWRTFSWLGIIGLVLSAEAVLDASATSLTAIFGTGDKFKFWRRKVVNLLVMLVAVAGSLLSIGMTAASLIFKSLKFKVYGFDILQWFIQSLTFQFVLPFMLSTVLVAVVYRMFSRSVMGWRHAFYGSLLFSTLWEAAKHLFAWFVYNFSSYNKVYGSLGAVMVLLVWIFYSSVIFLFAASFAKASSDLGQGRKAGRGR